MSVDIGKSEKAEKIRRPKTIARLVTWQANWLNTVKAGFKQLFLATGIKQNIGFRQQVALKQQKVSTNLLLITLTLTVIGNGNY